MEKLILTDVDGVLLNWQDGFDIFMEENGYTLLPNTEQYYNMTYRYIREVNAKRYNVDFKEISELVRQFNEGPNIENLEPYKDAPEYVDKLARLGFRFIAITSLSDHPDAYEYRANNLRKVFDIDIGPGEVFEKLICLPIGSSKQHILSHWANTGFYWIEDHFKNAEAGWEVGLKPLLVDIDHNRAFHTDLFPRLNTEEPWREIYERVLEAYEVDAD